MSGTVLIDTGPLVALLVRTEAHHHWTVSEARQLGSPLHTCEPVLTEAAHLLRRAGVDEVVLLEMLEAGLLRVSFNLGTQAPEIRKLLRAYRSVPMSLADACLVRMSELFPAAILWTLDSDFQIYRRNRTQPLTLMIPTQD